MASDNPTPTAPDLSCKILRQMLSTNKPILYGDDVSPPVRFVMMTAAALKIDYEYRKVDLFSGENKTEYYKLINPLQKVPALSVNDEIICDSHAIALYWCRGKNHDLYPDEPIMRAKIDEMIFYNSGVLFPIDSGIFTDFFAGRWPVDEVKTERWYSALDHLENRLCKFMYLTGEQPRLCDLCCGSTVSTLEILFPLLERHRSVNEWLKNLGKLPYYEINTRGLRRLADLVHAGGAEGLPPRPASLGGPAEPIAQPGPARQPAQAGPARPVAPVELVPQVAPAPAPGPARQTRQSASPRKAASAGPARKGQ